MTYKRLNDLNLLYREQEKKLRAKEQDVAALSDALHNLLATSKALHSPLDQAGWLSVTQAEEALAKTKGGAPE